MNISDEEEQKTVVYQENLKIDVKNINKNIKTIWRPIYDVIYVTLFEEKNIFPQHLLDLCKNDKHQFLSSNVKTVFKRMAVEQCLYAQVVLICWKDLDNNKVKRNTNK